jgi:2,3-dihydro-2,3-dihydroxybenzoate dehydrogenase
MELTGIRGRVALVPGASGGIGEAVARMLGETGAKVAVTDIDGDGAKRVAATIHESIGWRMDVTRSADVERTIGEIEDQLGEIDILVNVAGLVPRAPLLSVSDADFEALFAVNVRGVFNCLRAVGRRMQTRRRGAIVTVGSQGAILSRKSLAPYGASKAAASSLTKTFGLEMAEYGIRCNVVHPGVTETPAAKANWDAGRGSRATHVAGDLAGFRAPIPLGKIGKPEDAAATVLFLLSDQAGHITMEDIVVDGGATMIS